MIHPHSKPMRGLRGAALLLVFLLASAANSAAAAPAPPDPGDRAAFDRYVREGRDSPFGLDYVFALDPKYRDPELSRYFGAEVGVRWVNFAKIEWGQIEWRAPIRGKHFYAWKSLDEAVRQWQRYGVHICMSLRFSCPWARARPSGKGFVYLTGLSKALALRTADYLPKPVHRGSFEAFIAALVERYDGDGDRDMPGLRFPVLAYQIGNEYYNELYWAGKAEEYIDLLGLAYKAAHGANADVKILLSGLGLEEVPGFYDDVPDPLSRAFIARHLRRLGPPMRRFLRRGEDFCQRVLARTDLYDVLDARWPNYGIVREWRRRLAATDAPDREIWSGEVYSFFPLGDNLMLPNWTLHAFPVPSKSAEYRRILRNPRAPRFDAVNRWYRGLQAAQVVKITMTALHAGSRKVMMGWAVDVQTPFAPSTMAFQGILSATTRKPWPAARTYGLLIEKLDGLRSVVRLPAQEDVYLYECAVRDGRRVLVAFHDDHIGQNQGEQVGAVDASIPWPHGGARVTHILTELDAIHPEVETSVPSDGFLRLRLDEYPVFIEPAPRGR